MPLSLTNYETKAKAAVKAFWQDRLAARPSKRPQPNVIKASVEP